MRRGRLYTVVRLGRLIGDLSDFFGGASAGDVTNSATDATADIGKRLAETQTQAIVTGAQQAAAGLKSTAAQIEGDITHKLLAVGIVGGGLYIFLKKKGWL